MPQTIAKQIRVAVKPILHGGMKPPRSAPSGSETPAEPDAPAPQHKKRSPAK